ncbi:uncharacterized protein [Haliotis cracherodii]|uniref:uncharacterized protein n=1 Tax=Haliotis cracherodii TaxID=6455 RepID=UPI0039E9A587
MGVSIEIWRARIGGYCQPNRETRTEITREPTLHLRGIALLRSLKILVIISLLLILSGNVELNPGPTLRRPQQGPSQTCYTYKDSSFTTQEVLDILRNPDMSRTITQPPLKPTAGQVFLYHFTDINKRDDWRCDQYHFHHDATREQPKADPKFKKLFFVIKTREGKDKRFKKHAYILLGEDNNLVLFQYIGDERIAEDLPHGNSKNASVPYTRLCPSVIRAIKDVSNNATHAMEQFKNRAIALATPEIHQPRSKVHIWNTKSSVKYKQRQKQKKKHTVKSGENTATNHLSGECRDTSCENTQIEMCSLEYPLRSEIDRSCVNVCIKDGQTCEETVVHTNSFEGVIEQSAVDTDLFNGVPGQSAMDANSFEGVIEQSAVDTDLFTGVPGQSAADTDSFEGVIEQSAVDTDLFTGVPGQSAADTDSFEGVIEQSAVDTDLFTGVPGQSAADTEAFEGVIEQSVMDANSFTGVPGQSVMDANAFTGVPGQPTMDTNLYGNVPGQSVVDANSFAGVTEQPTMDTDSFTGVPGQSAVDTDSFEGVIEQSAVDTDSFTSVPGQSVMDANAFTGVPGQPTMDTNLYGNVPGQSVVDANSFAGVTEQPAMDTDSFTGVPGQSAVDTDSFEGVIEQSAVDTDSFTSVPGQSVMDANAFTGVRGQPTMDTNLYGNVPGQSVVDANSFAGVTEQPTMDKDSFTGVPGQPVVDANLFTGVPGQLTMDTNLFGNVPGQSVVDANSFAGATEQPTMDKNLFQGLTGPSAGANSAHSSNTGISPYLLPRDTDNEDVSTPASVSDHLSQRHTETHMSLSQHCDTAGVTGNHSECMSMTSTQRDDSISCEITCDDKTGTSVACINTAGNRGVEARDPHISPTNANNSFMCCRDMNNMCLEGPSHESSPCISATVIQMKETFGQPNLNQQGNGQLSTLAVSIDEFVFQIYVSGELINVIEVLSEFLYPQSYRKMRFMECLSLKSKEFQNESELSMFSDGSLTADRRCDPLFDVILTKPATSLITQSATLWKAEFDRTRHILSQYMTDIPPREQVTGCFLQLLSAVVLGSYKTHSRITQFVDTLYERPKHCQDITEHVCYVDSEYTYIIGTYSVTGRELTRLENSAWLDDSVIHAYMSLIMTEYKGQRNGKVFMFDCFLAEKWLGKWNDIDDGWLYLKESLLDYDWILMPVCRNHHWVLIAAHVKARQLSVIDSLPSRGSQSQHLLKQWRNYMAIRSKRTGENILDWEDRSCPIFPQTDGNSCGVIVLMVAEALLSGVPPAIMRNCHVKDYREYVKQRLLAAAGFKRCDKIEDVPDVPDVPDQPAYDAYQETDMDVTDDVELYSSTNDKDDGGTGFLRTNGHIEGGEEEVVMKGSLSMPRPVDHSMEEESQEAALDLRNVSTKIRHLFNNKHHQFVALLVACLRDGDLSFTFLNDTSDDQPCPLLQSPIRWACHIAGIEMVSLGELKHNLNLLCAFFTITSNDETATFEKQTIKHIVNELTTNHVGNYLQSIDIMFVHKHVRILPKCDAERSQFIIWLTRGSQELLLRRLSHELKQSNFALVLTHEACEQFQFVVSLLKLFQHNHVQMTQIVLEEDAIYGGSFLHWLCCNNNAELYKLIHSHIPSESKYDCITSCCISGNADILSIVLVEVKKETAPNWITKNEQPWLNIYRKKRMSIEKVTTFKMPPLHLACYHGHVNIVSLLIASDYDLNSHLPSLFSLLPDGPTPVIVATAEGHAPVLKCLIAANCDLSLGDETMDTSLHVACRKGFTDLVNLLVCQCNVSERNKDGDTPIHLACAAGYNDIVNTLLDHDADISLLNFRDYTAIDILSEKGHHLLLQDVLKKRPYSLPFDISNTPLHKACESGHIDVVEILLEHKADNFANCDHPLLRASKDNKVDFVKVLMETNSAPSLITTDHSYLLDVACRTKNVDIMKLLLDKGADPLDCDDEGDTCLRIAIEREHVELVKLLLDKSVDVQTTGGYSPLSVACRRKNVEIVKLLLYNGADPSARDNEGDTCLSIAIQNEHVEMVKLLLDKGANMEPGFDGHTPLSEACRTKNVEIVKLLLDKGANLSAFIDEGYSCLYMAIQNEHVELVKLLLDKGANVQTIHDEYSFLSEACRTKNVEIVKLLLDKGADPSTCDDRSYSCLSIAIQEEHVEIVNLLLDKGANMEPGFGGHTPLSVACRRKNVEIMKLLLYNGADPSARDNEGDTCLWIAIQNEHVEMVKLLLDKGANMEPGFDGHTPLSEACRTKNVEIVKLLLDKGANLSAFIDEGYSCLHMAIQNEHVELVKLLLDKGANVQTIYDEYSFLSEACRTKNVEIVKLLLDKGADPSACDDEGDTCLYIATENEHVELVKLLLDKGADVQTTDDGYSPLNVACRRKNVEIVKLLLDKGADPSTCDDRSYSCLSIAIQEEHVEIVNLLLDKGANMEPGFGGHTPLSVACRRKNVEIVKLLLYNGADPSARDNEGDTCLWIAIQNEHVEMVKLLLDKGANMEPGFDGHTPLSEACRTKNVEIVKLLLDKGANLSASIDEGYSCLYMAIQNEHVELVKLLLDKGANVQTIHDEYSFLSEACRTKNVDIVKLLLDKGADPSACDDEGDTCLYIATENEHVELVKLLLDKGADVQTTDDGYSPLNVACRRKNVEIVKLLLDNGADPSAWDDKCDTCLCIATENEHVEIVKLLLDKGADMEPGFEGQTPLREACRRKNVEIVKLLLDKGANLSASIDVSYSCLHVAIENEHVEMVKLLLDKGADVQTTDDGYSPLNVACRRKNVEIVKLLLDKGADPSACDHEGGKCSYVVKKNQLAEFDKHLLDKGVDVQTIRDGYSPLSEACRSKNVEIVKLLLDKGADPSTCDDRSYSCLSIAKQEEHVEIVNLLLDKGANMEPGFGGHTPLSEAYRTKNVEIVKLLLDNGADPSACDDKGYSCLQIAIQKEHVEMVNFWLDKGANMEPGFGGHTPLSEACRTKNVEIVKLLLDKGADPSASDYERYSCLQIAIQNEHVELLKLLLDKGANVQTTDDGYSPLSEACRRKNVEIVKLLLDNGADPSAWDDKGYPCLCVAIQKEHVEMVNLLLDKGANMEPGFDGHTPISEACRTKNVEIVKLLLDNGADPSACDDEGDTCLYIATENEHVEMVKLLLDKGADVQTTGDGYSPLNVACRRKNVEIVKLLLDNGADPSACDDKGYSCLCIAIQKEHVEMVKLLLDKGADVQTTHGGYSPLSEACRRINVEIVKLLLDKGACPPAADFMCNSASCRVGYLDVVKRLLEKGATVSAIGSEDYSTPEVVFRKGHFENVKLLRDNMDKMFFSNFLLRHHTTNLGILNSGEHEATEDNALLTLPNNEEYNDHKQLEDSKVADIVRQNDSVIYKYHGRSQCIAVCRKLFDKGIVVCKLLSCHKDLEPIVEEIIEIISDSDIFTDNENSISRLFQILLYESVVRRKAYLVYILIAKCGKNVTPTITRQVLNVAMAYPNNAILQMLLKYSSGDLVDGDLMSCACSRGLLQVIMVFIEKGYKFSPDHLRLALKHKHPIMTNLIVSNMSDPMPTGLVKELIKHGVRLGHGMIPFLDSEIFTSFNSDQIMFEACFHEQFDILKLLIDNGADVHCVNSGQKTLLHTACINDNETIVDFLIQSGICLYSCDSQGETPLHKAVGKNNSKVVQLLIKRGADVNCCSRVVSPLQLACRKGCISVIIILLKAGAEVNSFDTMQVTPVLDACKNRNFTVASLLLKHDAEVNVEDVHGTTPLHVACQHRDIVLIKLLLCHSADPFKRDKNKTCPLGFVVKDKDIMRIICEYTGGYALSCKDENGNTLLHHACMLGLLWHATNLLTRGIDSSQQNMKGESPMHIAVENENINLVRKLLRNNCTHTVPGNDGKMPLHIASEEGYTDIVELLLDHTDKERISATDNGGNSALHCASNFDKSGIIALLLEAGIKVNSINQKGSTPLHFAAEGGYLDAVKLLVHAKADINAFGHKGHTPLHRACFRGHISVVNFLLDNNADAVIQNSHKNTPMYAACLGQHMDVVKLLLEKGDYQQIAGPNGYPCVVVAASRGNLELLEIMISHNAHLSPSNLNVSLLSNESDIQHIYSLLVDEEEGISHMKVDDYQQIAQDVDKSNMDSLVPIHLAYDGNHMHAFKQLVDNGAILSDLDEEGKTVFQKAFRNKDEDNVALILSKGFQPDISSGDIIQLYPVIERCFSKRYFNVIKILYESWKMYSVNNTEHYTDSPVILAIIKDNISLLRYFLDMDGDFTERDEQGNTILHLACLTDNTKAVNVILQKQPHLLKFTNQDLKPLHVVCRQGSVELVKLFLQYSFLRENNYPDNLSPGDNACIYDSVDYHSAIEIAHEKRFTCIVNTLILHKERFPISSSNSIGESPFHWLCDSNDIGTLETILKTDIDPSEQDGSGYTVLHKACERGNKQMVTMLLETGDHSSEFSNAGEAPLHILCRKGFVDLIQMFIDRGADMSVKTKDKNNSVLHVACMYKRAEVCMFLLQRFACLSAEVNDDGYKPLDIAVERRCQKIVKLFVSVHNSKCLWYDYSDRICQKGGILLLKFIIRCSVNMAERDNMGNTFLHTAVSHGCVDVVLTLQKHCKKHFTSMSHMRNEQGELALHFAATKGDTAIVQTLIKYFIDPNVVDSNDATPLHHASSIGSKDIVLLLLTSGADPFIADAKGNTPLHLAAKGGHEGVCSSLVVNNANCNARNAKGRTSVHEAVGKGYLTITQLLIRSGAHVSVQDGRGDTPLHKACLNEHSDMVQCLLDAGADLSISNLLGNTPLHIASMKGHVGMICQLLRHQELEAVNVLGQTVLHLASINGHYNVLEIILKYIYRRELLGEHTRQDVSGRDLVNGDTALHLACRTGSVKSVEVLKKYGADVNVWNNNGNSPVFVACETGHVDIVKQCLHFAASGINRDGRSLLHIACRTGHEAMVKTLLEYGNVNITDRHGRTPLFDAVDNGHDIISTLLIRMGANVNSTNVYNRTPLHDACWEGRIGCVTLLTASGAQLDASNHYGNTPLHNACIQGHMAIGDLLLERGADSCPMNRVHMTPLHYACLYGYTETANMLLSKGADPSMENSEGKTPLELCSSQDLKETLTSSCRDTDLTCRKRGSTEVCALPPKKRMRMRIDTEELVDEVGQRSSEDVRRAYISWRMINGTL